MKKKDKIKLLEETISNCEFIMVHKDRVIDEQNMVIVAYRKEVADLENELNEVMGALL